MTPTRLEGKVAIVRGNDAQWLGPIADALSHSGAKVALVGEAGSGVKADMTIATPCAGEEEVRAALREIEASVGEAGVLVNGPLMPFYRSASETTDGDLALVQEQVAGTYAWTRLAGAAMAERGGGAVVSFITGLARRGLSNASADSMAQASIEAMTRSLALEWAGGGVRVNAIGLGWYETEPSPLEVQRAERLVRYLPLRRKGAPEDVLGLLTYLASGSAGYVTGQTVYVDGGAMAHG